MAQRNMQADLERRETYAEHIKKWRAQFRGVSWTYPPTHRSTVFPPSDEPMTVVHPRPPQYHNQLIRSSRRYVVDEQPLCHDDLDLNATLPGIQGIEDAIKPYEVAVGIQSVSFFRSVPCQDPLLFTGALDELDPDHWHNNWTEQVAQLLGGVFDNGDARHELTRIESPSNMDLWDLDSLDSFPSRTSTISPDTSDMTESELSNDSDPPPRTPKASKKSYARAVFGEQSGQCTPVVLSPMPSKPLSATALSFIPTVEHVPEQSPSSNEDSARMLSPTYEFHFPSLNSKPPPLSSSPEVYEAPCSLPSTLQKDENGFYVPVVESEGIAHSNTSPQTSTPRRASATFLPSFLAESAASARNRHTSKTRVIVDRLRSMTTRDNSSPSHKGRKSDVSHLRLSLSTPTSADASTPDTVQGHAATNIGYQSLIYDSEDDGWITGINTVPPEESGTGETKVTDDGWIECIIAETTRPRLHKRASSSVSMTPSSSASAGTFSSPAPSIASAGLPSTPAALSQTQMPFYMPCSAPFAPNTFAPTTPAMAQAAYMMQLQWQQAQAHAQWQLQMMQTHGPAYGAGLGGYPSYAPYAGPPLMQGRPYGHAPGQPIPTGMMQRAR